MRIRRSIALATAVMSAASAGVAAGAPGDRDPAFGTNGVAIVDLGSSSRATTMLVQDDGEILVGGEIVVSAQTGATDAVVARVLSPQGVLDPSFAGGAGWAALRPSGADEHTAQALDVQADGRIVVGGISVDSNYPSPFVARIVSPGGTPDTQSFGAGTGVTVLPGTLSDTTIHDVAVRPDGSIWIAGSAFDGPGAPRDPDMFLGRLLPSGAFDRSFGPFGNGAGWVAIGPSEPLVDDYAAALIPTPEGDVLLAGRSGDGRPRLAVARVDGVSALPVFTFGGGLTGVAIHAFGQESSAAAGLLEPDGRITLAGEMTPFGASESRGLVTRLKSDGSLDVAFAGTGIATMAFPGEELAFAGIARQPDGKLVVAGTLTKGFASQDIVVARLTPDGFPDSAFGSGGRVRIDLAARDSVADLALQPDGAILVTGTSSGASDQDIVVIRLKGDPPPLAPVPTGGGAPGGGAPAAGPSGPGAVVPAGRAAPSVGGGSARRATCGGLRATIVGTAGRDRLRGTPRGDVIAAMAGDDIVSGLGGADVICGGPGRDSITGGPGRDRLFGGAGADRLVGGTAADRLVGGPGKDALDGGAGKDAQTQ